MTNTPIGNIVFGASSTLPHHTADIDRLRAENAILRQQVADLRTALRTLGYQVQHAMPALTALTEARDEIASAWAKADAVMRGE